jgi:hypothetical protein
MNLREAAQQALEALKFGLHVGFDESSESQIKKGGKAFDQHSKAITALRTALAEPQEEPSPKMRLLPCCGYHDGRAVFWNRFNGVVQCHSCGQQYAPNPPQRKPLTDEEIALIVGECAASAHRHDDFSFARAIERAHGIGGEA